MKKSPSFLKSSNEVTETQRKTLGLERVKFVRNPLSTPSRTFVNASVKAPYSTGDGERANYVCH